MRFTIARSAILLVLPWLVAGPVSGQESGEPIAAEESVEGEDTHGPPPDFENAREVPSLDPDLSRPLPEGYVVEAIGYDSRTGIETVVPSTAGKWPDEMWIAGRELKAEVDESQFWQDTWDADLSAVYNKSYPWSTQCRLYFQDQDDIWYVCSGTMLDAKCMITAAQCVHEGNGGRWYKNWWVYPAWDGDADAYGSDNTGMAWTWTAWTDFGYLDYDMAAVVLNRPVGFLTGWLGYGYNNDDNFYTNTLFNMAGYPNGSSCYPGVPHQLYYGYGFYDLADTDRLHADVSWSCNARGCTGAGAYIISGGSRFIYANYSTECHGCNPGWTRHTRMTGFKFGDFVNTFVPSGYPTTEADYLPLDVNISPTSVTAGDGLMERNYLFTNTSLFNPPSTYYVIDAYLSTNDIISTFDTWIAGDNRTLDFGPKGAYRFLAGFPGLVPWDTPTGDYYVGVIIDEDDANVSNNDSSGWDAARIHVTGCRVDGTPFGKGKAGSGGYVPDLYSSGNACQYPHANGTYLHFREGVGGATGLLWVGLGRTKLDLFGGEFYIDFTKPYITVPIALGGTPGVPGAGTLDLRPGDLRGLQGLTLYLQATLLDRGAFKKVTFTNGLEFTVRE